MAPGASLPPDYNFRWAFAPACNLIISYELASNNGPISVNWISIIDNGDGTWRVHFQNSITLSDVGTHFFEIKSYLNTYPNTLSEETIYFKVVISADNCMQVNIAQEFLPPILFEISPSSVPV